MIEINSKDLLKEYDILLSELKKYDSSLLKKPKLLFITKSDQNYIEQDSLILPKNIETLFISSLENTNLTKAINLMYEQLSG